jgi:hypothetical protein
MTIRHDGMTLSTHFGPADEKYVRQTVLPCVNFKGVQVSYQQRQAGRIGCSQVTTSFRAETTTTKMENTCTPTTRTSYPTYR